MALVSSKRILDDASARGYAVGAFNVNNLEFAKAVMGAAQEANSPVIIQASEGAVSYAGVRQMVAMVRSLAEDTDAVVLTLTTADPLIPSFNASGTGSLPS